MPHIHTQPGQHDMTVSAYIIRTDQAEPLLLVHMHKKIGKLMQIGGHIELDETPWAALSHELVEESGYSIDEVQVLQPQEQPFVVDEAVVHPVPVLFNTHKVSDTHYHSDLVYALVVDHEPQHAPSENESSDLRWLTLTELQQAAQQGIALIDVTAIYGYILDQQKTYASVDTRLFALGEPVGAVPGI